MIPHFYFSKRGLRGGRGTLREGGVCAGIAGYRRFAWMSWTNSAQITGQDWHGGWRRGEIPLSWYGGVGFSRGRGFWLGGRLGADEGFCAVHDMAKAKRYYRRYLAVARPVSEEEKKVRRWVKRRWGK